MHANDNDVVLVSLNGVCAMTSLSRTHIRRLREASQFPQAVPLCERRIAFVRSEIVDWINERVAGRDRAAA